MSELDTETSVSGNFGETAELAFSNSRSVEGLMEVSFMRHQRSLCLPIAALRISGGILQPGTCLLCLPSFGEECELGGKELWSS